MPIESKLPAGALFDLDGTLVDTDACHLTIMRALFSELGLHEHHEGLVVDEAFFAKEISGRHNAEVFRKWLPKSLYSDAECARIAQKKEVTFREVLERQAQRLASNADQEDLEEGEEEENAVKAVPGVQTVMKFFEQRSVPSCIVTNAPRENAQAILCALGLDAKFGPRVVLGDECLRAKPFPDPYQRGAEVVGVDPAQCIAFEDSPSGITAAVAAGACTVAIACSGMHSEEILRRAGAHHIVRDFTEVTEDFISRVMTAHAGKKRSTQDKTAEKPTDKAGDKPMDKPDDTVTFKTCSQVSFRARMHSEKTSSSTQEPGMLRELPL